MQKHTGAPKPSGAGAVLRKFCRKCEMFLPIANFSERADKPGYRHECKRCRAGTNLKYKQLPAAHRAFRRRKNPDLLLMDTAKTGPLYKNLRRLLQGGKRSRAPLNTWTWLAANAYQTHCPVTGFRFELKQKMLNGAPHPLMPSLDRINSAKGYTPSNTRIVSFWANISKSAMPDSMFRRIVVKAADNMTRH